MGELEKNVGAKGTKSAVAFVNAFFALLQYATSSDYVTASYSMERLTAEQIKSVEKDFNKDYLLKKGGRLHSGVFNLFVHNLPSRIRVGTLRPERFQLYSKRYKAIMSKLCEKSENIYRLDAHYFQLNPKAVFRIQDHSVGHGD